MKINGNAFNVASLSKEFRMGFGDLVKVMPDLFKGAREAFQLITSVSKLFARLEVDV